VTHLAMKSSYSVIGKADGTVTCRRISERETVVSDLLHRSLRNIIAVVLRMEKCCYDLAICR
jgi:hypothetical protein